MPRNSSRQSTRKVRAVRVAKRPASSGKPAAPAAQVAEDPSELKVAKPLRDRLKDATRAGILEAAERVFAATGVQAARMEDIAQAAGVAVGTLYNHFSDRTALVEAIMGGRKAELVARLERVMQTSEGGSFETRLDTFISCLQAYFDESQAFLKMVVEAEGVHSAAKHMQSAEMMAQLRAMGSKIIEHGVRTRVVRADDAEYFEWFVLGVVRSLLMRRMKTPTSTTTTQDREVAMRFIFKGLEGRR